MKKKMNLNELKPHLENLKLAAMAGKFDSKNAAGWITRHLHRTTNNQLDVQEVVAEKLGNMLAGLAWIEEQTKDKPLSEWIKSKNPLIIEAAFRSQLDAVYILANCADENMKLKDKEENNILHCAAMGGNIELFKMAQEDSGLDLSTTNKVDYNLFHNAAQYARLGMLEHLSTLKLEKISPRDKEEDGNTAADICLEQMRRTINPGNNARSEKENQRFNEFKETLLFLKTKYELEPKKAWANMSKNSTNILNAFLKNETIEGSIQVKEHIGFRMEPRRYHPDGHVTELTLVVHQPEPKSESEPDKTLGFNWGE